jgi:hypothetical protein
MFKRNIVAGIIGLIIVGAFLAILCIWLKAAPLIIISAGVMALAAWDFFTAVKDISDARES